MKVLVTGGLGLIGSHVAEYYADQGHTVVIMDNLERSSLLGHEVSEARSRYNWNRLHLKMHDVVEVDVSMGGNWRNWIEQYGPFDVIVHCAAQCGVPTSIANPQRDFDVNVYGTALACEYARKWDAKMVYASTNKVYPIHSGWTNLDDRWRWKDAEWDKHGFPISGMHHPVYSGGARTPYGNSKYLGDLTCQEWAATYGTKIGVFRMSCIYGEHQMGFEEQGWATWFAIALEKGLPLNVFGDGQQVRDMLHVSDVVRAYDAFIQSDVDSGVWNLGGGPSNTLSINECIETLQNSTSKEFPSVSYSDWRPLDQKVYTSDIRALQSDLGWAPKVTTKDGMRGVAEWVKENAEIF